MTEKIPPWWRSFAGKRRKAARESAATLEQGAYPPWTNVTTITSNTKKSTPKPEEQKAPQTHQKAEGGSSMLTDETYDDSAMQPTFSEDTSRRHLRVSRSGRFKEKRHNRVSLPQNHEDSPNPASKGESKPPH
ncbi:proline-rich protein 15-like protein [Hoplias malabaricus]|uniref:proline-rich protein 15-like protein n=1 Tax=Hoplias malabaricus TaxID=27720 RepID=UPI003462EC99